MERLYKLMSEEDWEDFKATGEFHGSAADRADGFIHFSFARQVRETARRHFSGRGSIMLLALPRAAFGEALRLEPSRGGELFPHLYGTFRREEVLWARPIAPGADGVPDLPDNLEE